MRFVISPNSINLGANYITMVEVRPTLSAKKCSQKNLVFGNDDILREY